RVPFGRGPAPPTRFKVVEEQHRSVRGEADIARVVRAQAVRVSGRAARAEAAAGTRLSAGRRLAPRSGQAPGRDTAAGRGTAACRWARSIPTLLPAAVQRQERSAQSQTSQRRRTKLHAKA